MSILKFWDCFILYKLTSIGQKIICINGSQALLHLLKCIRIDCILLPHNSLMKIELFPFANFAIKHKIPACLIKFFILGLTTSILILLALIAKLMNISGWESSWLVGSSIPLPVVQINVTYKLIQLYKPTV